MLKTNNFLSSIDIKNKLDKQDVNISTTTVKKVLHELNYSYIYATQKLLISEKNIKKRLIWCEKYKDYDWDDVIFSDESTFYLNTTGKRWVNKNNNDRDFVVKHSKKIHIWGYISKKYGNGIYVFTENLTGEKYMDILKNQLPKNKGFTFQDDNDSKHRSKIVTTWKKENNIKVVEWPAYSPDLNPIENCWGILKKYIRKEMPSNIDTLKLKITDYWKKLNKKHICNMIDSMPKRINDVINNKGYPIKY
jgi:hypothetical protein